MSKFLWALSMWIQFSEIASTTCGALSKCVIVFFSLSLRNNFVGVCQTIAKTQMRNTLIADPLVQLRVKIVVKLSFVQLFVFQDVSVKNHTSEMKYLENVFYHIRVHLHDVEIRMKFTNNADLIQPVFHLAFVLDQYVQQWQFVDRLVVIANLDMFVVLEFVSQSTNAVSLETHFGAA